MSATLEIPTGLQSLTATVSLWADGSDTAASSGTSLTEASTRKGYYSCAITGLTGLHYLEVLVGSSPVWTGWVTMATSGTCVAADSRLEAVAYNKLPLNNIADETLLVAEHDATQAAIAALSIPSATAIAQAVVVLDMADVEATAAKDSLCGIVLQSRHWQNPSGNTLLIYQTDNTTLWDTLTLTKTAGDDPIRGAS